MIWIADALRGNPALALFLSIACGFVIGRLRLGKMELGPSLGSLLAGLVIGQLDAQNATSPGTSFSRLGRVLTRAEDRLMVSVFTCWTSPFPAPNFGEILETGDREIEKVNV